MPKRKRDIDEGAESNALQVPCGRCHAAAHKPCVVQVTAQTMMKAETLPEPERAKLLAPKNAKRAHACRREDGAKWVAWHKGIAK